LTSTTPHDAALAAPRGRGGRLRRVGSLLVQSVTAWWRDGGPRLGAALSYYTVFSLAPVLVVSVAIGGLVFGAEAASGRIVEQLGGLMGPEGASAVETLLERASLRPGAGIGATAFGVAAILFGASGAFAELQNALNRILNVEPPRGSRWWSILRTRLASFSLVLVIGFLLLVSLVVSAALGALDDIVRGGGALQPLMQALHLLVSFAAVTALFAAIFRVLPDTRLPWRDIWPGAAAAALLFSVGKFAIGLYLGNTAVASVYGAASSVVVLLVWVYYSAQILFLGAELTQALSLRRAS
jgi:membrane protein